MNLFNSKRGQGSNYLAAVVVIFLFGFFSILAYTMWAYFIDAITTAGYNVGDTAGLISNFTRGFLAFDYVIIILAIIFAIAIGLTSYRLATRPAFAIITIILGIFWGFISYFFNYVFIQLVSPNVFSATIGYFPRTMLICTNLHWLMLVYIVVGTLTLYGKKEQGQEVLT